MSETLDTKSMFVTALKQLTHKKEFSKITIADITQASGFNRQTFYYHFRDKYELLQYVYEQDAASVFDDQLSLSNWDHYLASLLQLMKDQNTFYQNTIRSDDSVFKEYVFQWAKTLFMQAIVKLDIHQHVLEEDKHFYSAFFSYGISGMVIRWVLSDMKSTPLKVATDLKHLVLHSEKVAYEHYHSEIIENIYETQD